MPDGVIFVRRRLRSSSLGSLPIPTSASSPTVDSLNSSEVKFWHAKISLATPEEVTFVPRRRSFVSSFAFLIPAKTSSPIGARTRLSSFNLLNCCNVLAASSPEMLQSCSERAANPLMDVNLANPVFEIPLPERLRLRIRERACKCDTPISLIWHSARSNNSSWDILSRKLSPSSLMAVRGRRMRLRVFTFARLFSDALLNWQRSAVSSSNAANCAMISIVSSEASD